MQRLSLSAALVVLLALGACRTGDRSQTEPVRSYLRGQILTRDSLQASPAAGLEVLVFHQSEARTDTLGLATTAEDGSFSMMISAPDRGVYPLLILQNRQPVKLDEIVVAEGDSASFTLYLPTDARPIRIRSRENDAWIAYRNAKAQYNLGLREAVGSADVVRRIELMALQTSSILWSLRNTFPGTVGAEIGAAESVMLLDGWNDSLLVVRADSIAPGNSGYVGAAQAARRAEARLRGQQASIDLLRRFQSRATEEEQRAALQAEIVTAHLDSLDSAGAAEAARELRRSFPRSEWAAWAERAEYEAQHLLPGMIAPDFEVTTRRGDRIRLSDLRGRVVVLEFLLPGDERFLRQLEGRNALLQGLTGRPFEHISVSLDADTLRTRTFFSQNPGGRHVQAPAGYDDALARQFNVRFVPTRFLIDAEGRLRGRYVGPAIPALSQDVLTLLQPPAATSTNP